MKKLTPYEGYSRPIVPTSFGESLSYYEQLVATIDHLNRVVEGHNGTVDEVTQMKNSIETLKKFTNDYFDNLDVQTEVNSKLQEMESNGSLQTIINQNIFSELHSELQNKIDATQVETLTAGKADKTEVQVLEQVKANKDEVNMLASGKAEKEELVALADVVTLKAEKAELNALASMKANQTQVDALASNKADLVYLETLVSNVSSGTPREVFLNIGALNATYPSGANYPVLVYDSSLTSGAHTFVWSGGTWLDMGLYQGLDVREKSITPKQLAFLAPAAKHKSTNLFDPNLVTRGYYIDYTTGNLEALVTHGVSDFIPVEGNTKYRSNNNEQLAVFNANKQYIGGAVGALTGVTTPANSAFVRLTVRLDTLENTQFSKEVGGTLPQFEKGSPRLSVGDIHDLQGHYIVSGKIKVIKNSVLNSYTVSATNLVLFDVHTSNFYVVNQSLTIPHTAGLAVIFNKTTNTIRSVLLSEINSLGHNDVQLFREHGDELKSAIIPEVNIIRNRTKLTVGSDLDCDFSSVKEAYAFAKTYSNVNNKVTIYIRNGDYIEWLDMTNSPYISLVGESKDVRIIDKSGDYYKCPIQVSGNAYFKNLTVIASHEDATVMPNPTSYAMHADYNHAGEMIFEDCDFISYQNSAVGIGTHQNQTLKFINCTMKKISDYDGGSFYAHNSPSSNVLNQNIIVKDCLIETTKGCAVKIDDANKVSNGSNSPLTIAFYNNIVSTDSPTNTGVVWYRDTPVNGGVSGQVKLHRNSFGNNQSSMNA